MAARRGAFIAIKRSESDEDETRIRADRIECVFPLSDSFRRRLLLPVRTGVQTFSGLLLCTPDSVESVRAKIDEATPLSCEEEGA